MIVDCVGVKKKATEKVGDETLQAVGRIGNGSLLSREIRIINAVCSMQNKMLSYSGSRNLNERLDAHFII